MKRILLYLFFLLFGFSYNLNAQFASSSNEDLLNYLDSKKETVTEINDPIKNWPECIVPQDLDFQYSNELITLIWDSNLEEESEYEIRSGNSKNHVVKGPSYRQVEKYLELNSEFFTDKSFDQIELRRICVIDEETFTSDWVLSPVPCWPSYDVCQDFNYDIEVDCSLNLAVISYTYTPQSCGTNIILDATSGVNTQSSNQNDGNLILPLDGDIVLEVRVMTPWQNQGNNSDDYWLCQFNEPDPCPQNADCDNDGILDSNDNCICEANANQADTDNDGIGDVCDNCLNTSNPNQEDTDSDGIGDACTIPSTVSCEDLSFQFSNSCITIEETGENTCLFEWNSSFTINSGNISYTTPLSYESISLSGMEGSYSIPIGANISIEYSYDYIDDNGDPQTLSCSESIQADCDESSNNCIENLELCDLLDLSITENNSECTVSWNLSNDYGLEIEICEVFENETICHSFAGNTGNIVVSSPTVQYNYTVSVVKENGEIEYANCIGDDLSCKSIEELDCKDTSKLCDVFNLINGLIQDENTVLLVFDSEESNYLENELNILDLDQEDVEQLLGCVSKINLNVDYSNSNNSNNYTTTLFETSADFSENTSSFDFKTFAAYIEGVETDNLQANLQFTITTVDGDEIICDQFKLEFFTEDLPDESDIDPPFDLPQLDCNSPIDIPDATNTDPLTTAKCGDLMNIKGFPFVVTEIETSGDGFFSGYGIAPIPFGGKYVLLEFDHIFINSKSVVTEGVINVAAGSPGDFPDFNVQYDPLTIGGDICLPPPPPTGQNYEGINPLTGLDPYGFNPTTGLNENGTPFDEDGFDIDGNHTDTGEPWNKNFCSREGFKYEPNENGDLEITDIPCDPESPPHPAVQNFLDSNENQINIKIKSVFDSLLIHYQTEINNLDCESKRQIINSNITSLQDQNPLFDPTYIKGENDEYINSGMHEHFVGKPEKIEVYIEGRDQRVIDIENAHVDLYDCDKDQAKFKNIEAILSQLSSDPAFGEMKNWILEEMKNWTIFEGDNYMNNPTNLRNWYEQKIKEYADNIAGESLFVFQEIGIEIFKKEILDIFSSDMGAFSGLASNENMYFESTALEEVDFYFDQGHEYIKGIHRAFYLEELAKRKSTNALIGETPDNVHTLPVTLSKMVGSYNYTIYLDEISFSVGGASLSAYLIIEDPGSGRKLVFKAMNINFGPNGPIGESSLRLGNDVEIRLNNASKLILKGGNNANTYVNWDCEGFTGMGIDTEIEFCRDFITPLDGNLNPIAGDERYRLDFEVEMDSWLEFNIDIDAEPFAITKYEDVKWEINNMYLDFSSTSTPQFPIPKDYQSEFVQGEGLLGPLWKGFYMQDLFATLPNKFSKNASEPLTIEAHNLIIDDTGVSGEVSSDGLSILSLDDGDLSGWPFSIDKLGIHVLQNHINGFDLGGELKVSIFEEPLAYDATVSANNIYRFKVTPEENLSMNMLLADVTLSKSSKILITNDPDLQNGEEGFLCVAHLNGELEIESGIGDLEIALPPIRFQNFKVSNKAPYFEPGNWTLPLNVGASYGGFSLSLNKGAPYKPYADDPKYAGLMLDVGLELEKKYSISAQGGIGLIGKLEIDNDGKQSWVYDDFQVLNFCVGASFPGVKNLTGCLNWFKPGSFGNEDGRFGSGFQGYLDVEFSKFIDRVSCVGMFGKMDNDWRYFFVDAMATLDQGITLGPIEINGFAGGISYHMASNFEPENVNFADPFSLDNLSGAIGESFSGVSYLPNQDIGLGLKAAAMFRLAKSETLFNGSVQLGMEFNSDTSGSSGINNIYLRGLGQMLSEIDLDIPAVVPEIQDSAPEGVNSALSAYVDINYNFNQKVFHGEMGAYLDTPFLKGDVENNNKLIDAVVHFDPNDWYINIGTPDRRCTASLDLVIFKANLTAYLDVGNSIPNMPELPQTVKDIAHQVVSNESLRKSGGGLVFGASFDAEVKVDAKIAKAELKGGAGFDVMLRKYNETVCQETGEEIGINGWYAAGQAWIYIVGALEVFGINVLDIGIAAALQARLPNPAFIQGTAGFYIDTWWKKFDGSMSLAIGQTCTFQNNDPNDPIGFDVISLIDPENDSEDVAINSKPVVYFNIPIHEQIELPSGSETSIYEVFIEEISIESQGYSIPTNFDIEHGISTLELRPEFMFPPESEVSIHVAVRIIKDGVEIGIQEKTNTFTTGPTIEKIPETNIIAAYPADGSYNFYRSQKSEQYIILKQGMPDLFYNIPDDMDQKIQVTKADGESHIVDYNWDELNNKLVYSIGELLDPDALYKLEFVRLKKGTWLEYTPANSGPTQSLGGVTGSTNSEDSDIDTPNKIVLYRSFFRTSIYNTIESKIQVIDGINIAVENTSYGKVLTRNLIEPFDKIEILGDAYMSPMVRFDATAINQTDNDYVDNLLEWYNQFQPYSQASAEIEEEYYEEYTFTATSPSSINLDDVQNNPFATLIIRDENIDNLFILSGHWTSGEYPQSDQKIIFTLDRTYGAHHHWTNFTLDAQSSFITNEMSPFAEEIFPVLETQLWGNGRITMPAGYYKTHVALRAPERQFLEDTGQDTGNASWSWKSLGWNYLGN